MKSLGTLLTLKLARALVLIAELRSSAGLCTNIPQNK